MSPVAIVENVSSCVRDVRSLAILTSQGQEQELKGGVEVDLFVDQLGPEDRAVRTAEAEQQRGGDLAADQVPEGDRRAPLNGTK